MYLAVGVGTGLVPLLDVGLLDVGTPFVDVTTPFTGFAPIGVPAVGGTDGGSIGFGEFITFPGAPPALPLEAEPLEDTELLGVAMPLWPIIVVVSIVGRF